MFSKMEKSFFTRGVQVSKSKKFISKIREYLGISGILLLLLFAIFLCVAFLVSLDCKDEELICYLFGVKGEDSKEKILEGLGFGLIALLGILVANRRAAAMEKTAKAQADSAKAQLNTVQGTEEGRRQERFRDAVRHLGNESESVRQGGAYGLFHLALEEESLRQSIAEILCAHIRGVTRESEYRKEYKTTPSTEVQSLMTLLFSKRDSESEESLKTFWKGITPDLSGGYFRGVKLKEAQFQGARFLETQFQGANLYKAQFQGANLLKAQFQGAKLPAAKFQRASLYEAQFQGAKLPAAKFQGADLSESLFQKADLSKAQFQGAVLHEAQFQGADLSKTQFQGAILHEAQFQGAILYEAQFQEADFKEAKFQGVYSGQRLAASFQERIRNRIDQESDLSTVVFSGGLTQEKEDVIASQLESLILEDEVIDLKDALKKHVGKPRSNIPPDSAETGKYDKNQADQWIVEYEKAMNKDKDS